MSRSLNKVFLIGHLGQDPDQKFTPSGNSVVNLSLATSENWKDKETGESQERTEWHRLVFFGKLAEVAAEYLKSGAQVHIEGRLRTRKWHDEKNEIDRYTTEIVVEEMIMLGKKPDNAQES